MRNLMKERIRMYDELVAIEASIVEFMYRKERVRKDLDQLENNLNMKPSEYATLKPDKERELVGVNLHKMSANDVVMGTFEAPDSHKEYEDPWLGNSGLELHKAIGLYLTGVWVSKNEDYGDSFTKSLDQSGLIAAVVRMNDKINRLESLGSGKNACVNDESLEDTCLDLANYAIMTAMYLIENRRKNG